MLNIIRLIIKSKRMKWAEMKNKKLKMTNAYKIVAAKHEGIRSLDRPKCRLYNSIKMNHKDTGSEWVDSIQLDKDRV
jgi:hypothetical protein